MRFLMMHKDPASERGEQPSAEFGQKMNALMDKLMKSGAFVAGEGVHPSQKNGLRLSNQKDKNGKRIVKDGPFSEAKEVIGGFVMLNVKNRDEAQKWAEEFMDLWEGKELQVEIRQVVEWEDLPPELHRK
jgi:hypothetical protein